MSTPEKTEQYVLHTYNRAPFTLVRGEGAYVYDSDGNRYLDFASGISVNALGHADADIAAAVSEQIMQLSHVCNLYLFRASSRSGRDVVQPELCRQSVFR